MTKDWKFEDNSKKAKKHLGAVSEEAMEAAVLFIEGQAKPLAPVSSGELRDKIDHSVKRGDDDVVIGKVGSPLDYAPYVEYGTGEFAENGKGRKGGWGYTDEEGTEHWTRGSKPQSFLRPAFRRNRKQIEQIIGGKFKTSFKGK